MNRVEKLIDRYFEVKNRQDLDGILASYDDDAVIITAEGRRVEGNEAIRSLFECEFAMYPDCYCALTHVEPWGHGVGVAKHILIESRNDNESPRTEGVNLIRFRGDKIMSLHVYQPTCQ